MPAVARYAGRFLQLRLAPGRAPPEFLFYRSSGLRTRTAMAMAVRVSLGFLILLLFSNFSTALYEDQVGLADWSWHWTSVILILVVLPFLHNQKRKRELYTINRFLCQSSLRPTLHTLFKWKACEA